MRPFAALKAFRRHLRPHAGRGLLAALCGALALVSSAGLLALAGWFLAAAAAAGLNPGAARAFNIALPGVGVRLFAFTRIAARYAERLIAHDAALRILQTLRVWFYERLEPLAPACLARYRSGDILGRLVADIDALDNLCVRLLSPAAAALAAIAALGVFLGLFDAGIAAAALGALAVAVVAVPWAAGAAAMKTGRGLAEAEGALRTGIVEAIQGLAELTAFGAAERHLAELRGHHRRVLRLQRRLSRVRGLSAAGITLLSGAALWAALGLGAGRVAAGSLSGEALVGITLAVWAAFEAAPPLAHAFQLLGRTRQAAERILALTSLSPAVQFAPTAAGPPQGRAIAFEAVRFAYRPGAPPALDGLDLRLPPGGITALTGETGCGKSTLVHLLARHWDPDGGRIRIGGREIRELSEPQLRRLLTVISQQAHVFNDTIAANLRVAAPKADAAQLWRALETVRLADHVRGLPDGLDTWVGEGGGRLSGGERRRLALARAVLHDGPIWVLDEPTEGLDPATAGDVMRGLLQRAGGRTVLIITHRRMDFGRMDQVALMEKGRIAAAGAHDELLRTERRYRELLSRMA
jgi:ATP-binding cassette subfamily C protein CydC